MTSANDDNLTSCHQTEDGAYRAGREDYHNRQPHCPFEEGNPLAAAWMRGVEDARMEVIRSAIQSHSEFNPHFGGPRNVIRK